MPMPLKNLSGKRFGRLTVIWLAKRREKAGGGRWHCRCDCGDTLIVRARCLVQGVTKSCGCLVNENTRIFDAGSAHNSLTYRSWAAMKTRCTNPNAKDAKSYIGRGIKICDRWLYGENGKHPFYCFLEDMGKRSPGTTLDRYPNNDGDYEPGNCRWATNSQQGKNKRPFTEEHKQNMRKPKSVTYKHTPEWIAKRVKSYMETCAKRKLAKTELGPFR